ncbi:BspA family leucine-rich repeat surface protein [Companilactobacillus zhachilii]|uniref:BspA family leucine-rich repeat surface protein n=1 Tax=Companilactobacillus zhachilii TaxID=2304606 RepID=A0A386PWN2_9LACO|nr:BspA family leucine-rich repeat surface protein [Companilactobacillus zhachilii]AYE39103.1 BspA family leucine-rich repeat surface protein [Companilactobacillus zhachilii]
MDTSNVTNMSQMFLNCRSLKKLDLSSFNTNSVQDMSQMFGGCSDLRMLNITNFDTSKVTNMNGMFAGCETLEELDLSNFDTKNVQSMDNMFQATDALKSLKLGDKFVVPENKEKDLKLVDRTWIDVGTGTTKNPKPTNKIGISSDELLKHHDKGNWVVKPEKEYLGNFRIMVANNLHKDIVVTVPDNIRPEYVGSVFEVDVPKITGYTADKKTLTITAIDEGLISNDEITYTKVETKPAVKSVPTQTTVKPSNSLRLAEDIIKPKSVATAEPKTESKIEPETPAKPEVSVDSEPDVQAEQGKVSKFMNYISVHSDIKEAKTYSMDGQLNEGNTLRRSYSWFSDKELKLGNQKYYHVLGDSWVKAEDVYIYREAQNLVKTSSDVVMTNLYNSRAELLTNRGLSAGSTWQTSKEVMLNNHKYYQITANEFVDSDNVEVVNG